MSFKKMRLIVRIVGSISLLVQLGCLYATWALNRRVDTWFWALVGLVLCTSASMVWANRKAVRKHRCETMLAELLPAADA